MIERHLILRSIFFLFVISPLRLLPFTYAHFRFPFLLPSSRQRSPPWECDRSYSLLCCIAFARGHRKTAENLCRYSRSFHKVCPQSTVSEKMTSRSAFRHAGRGSAVIHPSTDPAPSCLTWPTVWCRTPAGHLPDTCRTPAGHLPHTERCR